MTQHWEFFVSETLPHTRLSLQASLHLLPPDLLCPCQLKQRGENCSPFVQPSPPTFTCTIRARHLAPMTATSGQKKQNIFFFKFSNRNLEISISISRKTRKILGVISPWCWSKTPRPCSATQTSRSFVMRRSHSFSALHVESKCKWFWLSVIASY